jgi:pyruvate/2-oxoglutarate/acetoin dehydrogenase E1 component
MGELKKLVQQHLSEGGFFLSETAGSSWSSGLVGKQVIQTGLSEGASVGVGLGLAAGGKKVLVELVDAGGLLRAGAVLKEALALMARSEGTFPLSLVVLAPEPESGWPIPEGVRVLSVSAAGMWEGVLSRAFSGGVAVVLLAKGVLWEEEELKAFSTASVEKQGSDCTLAAWGSTLGAIQELELGDTVELVAVTELFPVSEVLAASVRKTGRLVLAGPAGCDSLLSRLTVSNASNFWRLEAPPCMLASSDAAEVQAAIHKILQE